MENNSLELTCYASNNTTTTKWSTLKNKNIYLVSTSKEGKCNIEGLMSRDKYLGISCYSNGAFKLHIKSVNIRNHDQVWFYGPSGRLYDG
jgi:hypothetical protein